MSKRNSIVLEKGQGINLNKAKAGLTKIRIGLGWEQLAKSPLDLDASVFACKMVNNSPKLLSEKHFVFYNNLSTPNGAIQHSGDNRVGGTEGDDEDEESITVELGRLENAITEISILVTIHEAREKRQNFGMLRDAYIRIYDDVTNDLICQYDLDATFSQETSVQFGSVVRNTNGDWNFNAIGAGYKLTLGDFVDGYL